MNQHVISLLKEAGKLYKKDNFCLSNRIIGILLVPYAKQTKFMLDEGLSAAMIFSLLKEQYNIPEEIRFSSFQRWCTRLKASC